ncbi:endoplasmic reticulum vesicle transporter-domain-containing protein [Cunninghamella echinulata]|nr:endoplasmic reticulum vesicle transporter-domain-containing protein [Cunninghamella echinulata]
MVSKSFLSRFKRLDAYAKTLDDFRVVTTTGGTVTLISASIIIFLVLIETWSYLTPVFEPEIVVDGGKMEKLPINFDITFPNLPCNFLSLDIMDESGGHISNYEHDIFKIRLDEKGNEIHKEKQTKLSNNFAKENTDSQSKDESKDENYCGSCYGANSNQECCNTCEDVKIAYEKSTWAFKPNEIEQCIKEGVLEVMNTQSNEGCRMYGQLLVNKIRGNFHFSPGQSFAYGSQHVHDVRNYLLSNHNFKHEIKYLQFGDQKYLEHKQKRTKALLLNNPLDITKWGNNDGGNMYQFFLKIVPTQFDFLSGRNNLRTFQYSVTRHERSIMQTSGGVFFHLDFSPMRVIYTEKRKSLASYLSNICAIIGGIFTVASIVDGVLYRAEISLQKKNAIGKSS